MTIIDLATVIPFEQWLANVAETLEPCPRCEGEGKTECGICLGDGFIEDEDTDDGDFMCPDCYGDGEVTCPLCNGNYPRVLYLKSVHEDAGKLRRWTGSHPPNSQPPSNSP